MNVHPDQESIPVPEAPAASASLSDEERERLYALEMGEQALARQRRLFAEELRDCTCGVGDDKPTHLHQIGCHRVPLKRARKAAK